MRTRSLSLTTVFGFLGLIMLVHSFQSFAATGKIECETAFGEKKLMIEEGLVAFQKEDEAGVSRSISSVKGHAVRTHKKHLGFSKSMYIDGLKYRINVKNTEAFSDVDDYLSITSPKGHEMTYPLTCHSV